MNLVELILWAAVITMAVVAPLVVMVDAAARAARRRLAQRPRRNPFDVSDATRVSRARLHARAARTP